MTNNDKTLVERLRAMSETCCSGGCDACSTETEAADRIEALSAENERLREALEIIAIDGLHTPSKNVSLARATLGEGHD